MNPQDEPTLLSTIEAQKENIMPLPGGRSARSLAATILADEYPETANPAHAAVREAFEEELKTAPELDDPLDVYIRYVKWVVESYPSGGGTLLQTLLYRATHNFEDSLHYKNDPRYMKLWIQWIGQYSDSPREIFAFLARKSIGNQLALYYEEFAAFLETNGRMTQAEEIYELGIQNNARPIERLTRKYNEFVARLAANPPNENDHSSPALPVVRAALGAKFTSSEPSDPQAPPSTFGAEGTTMPKKKEKLQIFSDNSAAPALPESDPDEKGWGSIASLAERKKENVIQARPWAGEKMKQEGVAAPRGEKLQIFRDAAPASSAPKPAPTAPVPASNGKVKRPERVFVALELIYPDSQDPEGSELCFEELRAQSRGLLDVDWNALRQEEVERNERRQRMEKQKLEEESELESMMHSAQTQRVQVSEKQESPALVHAKTVTVALASSPKGKMKRRPRGNNMQMSQEPTMTFHTKAANDEIYSIFNQPLSLQNEFANQQRNDSESSDDDEEEGEEENEDTINSRFDPQDERTDLLKGVLDDSADLSVVDFRSINAEQGGKADKLQIHHDDQEAAELVEDAHPDGATSEYGDEDENEDEEEPCTNYGMQRSRQAPFMTPITERTESLPPSTMRRGLRKSAVTPSRRRSDREDALIDLTNNSFHDLTDDENVQHDDDHHHEKMSIYVDKENLKADVKPYKQEGLSKEMELLSFDEIKSEKPAQPQDETSPIIPDAQCNPIDPILRDTIWDKITPPLDSFAGFHGLQKQTSAKTDAIRKYIKAVSRQGDKTSSQRDNIPAQPIITLPSSASYSIKRELGKGAFAPVYLVENNELDEEEEADMLGDHRNYLEALKMETPPTPWEFYITRVAHTRLGNDRAAESIVRVHELHLFRDEAFLILDYHPFGTLLDLVNLVAAPTSSLHTTSGTVDEPLVMFYTIELLRTIDAMHENNVLHGDLKVDNCLIRFPISAAGSASSSSSSGDNSSTSWSSRYTRDGSDGWRERGMVLIDLGRAIDMSLYRKDVGFIADWRTDSQDCPEMREMRPWTYQVDYYGVACVVHSLLFGKYIETMSVPSSVSASGNAGGDERSAGGRSKEYKITTGLKRYWQQEMWGELFDVLLNPGKYTQGEEGGVMPVRRTLKGCREKMEDWLETNCERGVGLKGILRKVEEGMKKRK